jgi:hypothetical protein
MGTTNFNPHVNFSGSSENLHVIERFQRVDAQTILYRATIDDPTTFTITPATKATMRCRTFSEAHAKWNRSRLNSPVGQDGILRAGC